MILRSRPKAATRELYSLLLLFAVLLLCSTGVRAQTVPAPPNPSSIDERSVNLLTGGLVVSSVDLTIGPSDYHGLSFERQYVGGGWRIADVPTVSGSTTNPIVSYGGHSIPFKTVSGVYVPQFADGSSLNSTRTTFTSSDGTVIQFGVAGYQYPMFEQTGSGGLGTQITYPDGTVWNFAYNQTSYTDFVPGCYVDQFGTPCTETFYVARLSSITSSTGYQIKLAYAANTIAGYDNGSGFRSWSTITKATAINNAVEYCDPAAVSCSPTNTWRQVTYTVNGILYTQFTGVTNSEGRVTSYTYANGRLATLKPGSASSSTSYAYNSTNGKITSVTTGGGIWAYAYPSSTQTTVTDPSSNVQTTNYDASGLVTSVLAGGQTTYFSYYTAGDPNGPVGALKQVTSPNQNYTIYTYDARGNQTAATSYPKPGSGTSPASMVTSAIYPTTCTNQKTCNKPTSITDAHNNTTSYSYDPGSGGVATITGPADASGVHPQTRVGYGTVYAWYKNSSGTLVQGPAMTMPTSISQCRITASCAGTSDEKLKTIAYPTSGASNAQPSSITLKVGDNSVSETTALTYDNFGQVLTIDGPLSGAGDTTRIRYDQYGEIQGQVAPAPGVDSLANMATKFHYDSLGHVDVVESGSVPDQSDNSWNNSFSETSRVTTSFDGYGRAVRQQTMDGTASHTPYETTDTVYDTNGRVACTIVRMDPAQWGSTAATTCSPPQTTGPNGPDRVTQYTYDGLDRMTKVSTGVGITSVAADDVTTTYTPNGQVWTQADANGNTTTYSYDGYSRLAQIAYPLGSTEQYTYPTVSTDNWVTYKTRAGQNLTFKMDALNRVTEKDSPAGNVLYGYDLFGDTTSATFAGTSNKISYTFDALGRKLTETQAMDGATRTLTSAYASDNSRTQLTYPSPDTNYINYNRDNLGRIYYTALNGNLALFYPQRQSNGRLNALYRLNTSTANWGMPTVPGYDGISRPTSFGIDLAGSSYDSTTTLAYNPASQIMSQARTNDAYAWTAQSPITGRAYAPNALNQYSSVAGVTQTYDTNGNLTSDGTNTFVYDAENRMISAAGGGVSATLRYDPLGRLYEVNGSATGITRFLYDGDDLIAEYNSSGTMLRRYVHGDSSGDDPQVWFEGSGVTDAARRYLYADERGSIVAVTDSAGNIITNGTNTYDEYGIPGVVNQGRFQYTGQAWIPELGMYYYKARMYSPTLGRFMQTDPIGYGDGMNMYRYVHSDPVNGVDPTGQWDCWGNDCITVNGTRLPPEPYSCEMFNGCYSFGDYCARFGCGSNGANMTPSGSSGGGGGGPAQMSDKKPQSVGCNTVLPNGKTVGDYVREERAVLKSAISTGTLGGDIDAFGLGAMASIAWPHGPIDFKNTFRGQADRRALGDAGNFAYYAIGTGIISNVALDAGAGAYGVTSALRGQKSWSDLTGPMLSDQSAASVRDAGLASGGCPK